MLYNNFLSSYVSDELLSCTECSLKMNEGTKCEVEKKIKMPKHVRACESISVKHNYSERKNRSMNVKRKK